jgi:NAD(P)-dependent dehydrogenase (short-subunit alcohol dehydrogenase family)
VASLRDTKHAPLFVACDLTDVAALRAALERIRAALGPAAVLVNNAANDLRQALGEVTPDQFDWMMAVNLRHVYFACQAVVPQMIALGQGSIVNMSSLAWMFGTPDLQAYAAAKAAIVGLTNSLARQYGAQHIRVNAIAPGLVLTEKQRRLWFQDDARLAAVVSRQALPEVIEPADIARLALFLASDDSRMITKQTIAVNGGTM